MKDTLHKYQYILIISHSFLIKIRNVSDKSCRENQNRSFAFSNFSENHAVYEIRWKNIVEWGMPQTTLRLKRIACWIPKAPNKQHSGCVILILFPLQQWLQERSLVLLYTHIACLVE